MLSNQKYTSKTSISLMLLGLLPFISAIYYLQTYDFERGLAIFIHYSAIILSFIGAINWGRNDLEKSPKLFYLSVTPSIIAFSAFFLDFPDNLSLLAIGYLVAWLIDFFLLIKNKEFLAYIGMRSIITISVIYLHIYLM
ncbi:MAG: hypothetical protein CMQ85_00905 [Gammaproteobacteria bacterium]|nr:hypothetical protein [Gammaproteobacteria bacterium]|tara:strand:- start:392 stop:808 length:417 start_codon:yes stop_codon:yes gene_type:complete